MSIRRATRSLSSGSGSRVWDLLRLRDLPWVSSSRHITPPPPPEIIPFDAWPGELGSDTSDRSWLWVSAVEFGRPSGAFGRYGLLSQGCVRRGGLALGYHRRLPTGVDLRPAFNRIGFQSAFSCALHCRAMNECAMEGAAYGSDLRRAFNRICFQSAFSCALAMSGDEWVRRWKGLPRERPETSFQPNLSDLRPAFSRTRLTPTLAFNRTCILIAFRSAPGNGGR